MSELNEERCWELLEQARFGRLGVYGDGEVDVIPINFVAHESKIYFRTAYGSSALAKALAAGTATLEIDSLRGGTATSVIVRGPASVTDDPDEISTINALGLLPWVPTRKRTYVVISPTRITGRHFMMGHERNDPALSTRR